MVFLIAGMLVEEIYFCSLNSRITLFVEVAFAQISSYQHPHFFIISNIKKWFLRTFWNKKFSRQSTRNFNFSNFILRDTSSGWKCTCIIAANYNRYRLFLFIWCCALDPFLSNTYPYCYLRTFKTTASQT